MGLLARILRPSGPTHGSPTVLLFRVQETWYPLYQTLSVPAIFTIVATCWTVVTSPINDTDLLNPIWLDFLFFIIFS
jgi:hypothetical protein